MNKNLSIMDGDPNEFILGIPRHKYFTAQKLKAMIIGASDYSALREEEGKENYLDLPETPTDCEVILKGIRKLGFEDENIVYLEEPSWKQVHLKILETAMNIQKDAMEGISTLFYFYYAGHGMSDTNLYLQLNE